MKFEPYLEPYRLRVLLPLCGLLSLAGRAAAQKPPEPRPAVLVGHWRRTRIVMDEPIDDHLMLSANGRLSAWQVTAKSRSAPQSGRWRVEEKQLMLQVQGEEEGGAPFFMHEGRLVFPNIPNRRQFWDRVQ